MAHDEIGPWSELKIEIIRRYAQAYRQITSRYPIHASYIDAFSGCGMHARKGTGEAVEGSPLAALQVEPRFDQYYFIDIDNQKSEELAETVRDLRVPNVLIREGDCNRILVEEVIPKIQFRDFKRALCLLDPYKLQLEWEVLEAAARSRTIEVFVNFPIMAINRTLKLRDPNDARPRDIELMTRFWGNDDWHSVLHQPSQQGNLFDNHSMDRRSNSAIVSAFESRLKEAGFNFVARSLAMRNTRNSDVYYFAFAGPNATGHKIASEIFNKHRSPRTPR